jgi:hypothetical protein
MTDSTGSIHGSWASRWTFIMAATGSAVGLGNIWKFPYITGENGGGAFVLVYLACILSVGIPVMMAEIMLGRMGRRSPIGAMKKIVRETGAHRFWNSIGWVGVIAGLLILSYYAVIAGWALAYIVEMASGRLQGASGADAVATFNALLADPGELIFWQSIFMLLTMLVVIGDQGPGCGGPGDDAATVSAAGGDVDLCRQAGRSRRWRGFHVQLPRRSPQLDRGVGSHGTLIFYPQHRHGGDNGLRRLYAGGCPHWPGSVDSRLL